MIDTDPFFFFSERVTRDVAAAAELLSPRTLRVTATMQVLLDGLSLQVDSIPRGPRAEMRYTDWRLRIAGLLNLKVSDPSSDYVHDCLTMAFDDPDERVRGTAWLTVAEWLRSTEAKAPFDACGMELRERFVWHDDSTERQKLLSPRAWLEALARHADVLEMREQLNAMEREINTKDETDLLALSDVEREVLALNSELITTFLEHRDPIRRCAGLIALRRRRQCEAHVVEIILRLATSDRELRVRIRALEALSAIYEGTQDRIAMRAVAALVIDTAQPEKVRALAYDVLVCIDNRPYNERPVVIAHADALLQVREEDVDWKYVYRFVDDQLPGQKSGTEKGTF